MLCETRAEMVISAMLLKMQDERPVFYSTWENWSEYVGA